MPPSRLPLHRKNGNKIREAESNERFRKVILNLVFQIHIWQKKNRKTVFLFSSDSWRLSDEMDRKNPSSRLWRPSERDRTEPPAGVELPEVGTVNEEQAHHGAVQQEHAGHVEIRRVAHP